MIPALVDHPSDPTIGDIGPVPAVNAIVESGGKSIACIGIIETGAGISILDEELFERLEMQTSLATLGIRTTGPPEVPVAVYTAAIRLRGESEGELVFNEVPIVRS